MRPQRQRPDWAVSPVIATILMVAITVVLVGALWLWVSSITGGDKQPEFEGVIIFNNEASGTTGVVLIVNHITNPAAIGNLEWRVLNGNDQIASGDMLQIHGLIYIEGGLIFVLLR